MKICEKCGAEFESEQLYCNNCMSSISNEETVSYENQQIQEDFDPIEIQNQQYQKMMEAKEQIKKYNSLSDNYLLGFVGSLLGGIVGAIPWVIVSCLGWFVGWLGYLIAITASKGYDLMKVKVKMCKLWFVAISVVISVFVGQIVSDVIYIVSDPEIGFEYLGAAFAFIFEHFGLYLSEAVPNLILGLIFAALGGFSVLKEIKNQNKTIKGLKELYPDEDI